MTAPFSQDQLNQMAAMMAAAFQAAGMGPGQQPAQAPAAQPVQAARDPRPVMATPRDFDGSLDQYQSFKREVVAYIQGNPGYFTTDERKILFTLSFMKKGEADAWNQTYTESCTVLGTMVIPDTWSAFVDQLDAAFADPNQARKALEEFNKLTQGSMTAEIFFSDRSSNGFSNSTFWVLASVMK